MIQKNSFQESSSKRKCRPSSIAEWLGVGITANTHIIKPVEILMQDLAVEEKDNDVSTENLIYLEEDAVLEEENRLDDDAEDLMDYLRNTKEKKEMIMKEIVAVNIHEEGNEEAENFQPETKSGEVIDQEGSWQISKKERKRRNKFAKQEMNKRSVFNEERRVIHERNLWELSLPDRWMLYRTWVQKYKVRCQERIGGLHLEYNRHCRRLQEVKDRENLYLLKSSKVVGMTTTGAARLQNLLKQLKPSILIVEEAAEVLEAHIVASLTESCQHLILIGDHQQLRPSPTVYELSVEYNLDV